jgi:hypothetical protein
MDEAPCALLPDVGVLALVPDPRNGRYGRNRRELTLVADQSQHPSGLLRVGGGLNMPLIG